MKLRHKMCILGLSFDGDNSHRSLQQSSISGNVTAYMNPEFQPFDDGVYFFNLREQNFIEVKVCVSQKEYLIIFQSTRKNDHNQPINEEFKFSINFSHTHLLIILHLYIVGE